MKTQKTLTAAQALASNLNGNYFELEIRTESKTISRTSEVRKIFESEGLIYAEAYWKDFGWINEPIHPCRTIYLLGKYDLPLDPITALSAPTKYRMQPKPTTTSRLFSQDQSEYDYLSKARELSSMVPYDEALAAVIVYEVFNDELASKQRTKLKTALEEFINRSGGFQLRQYSIVLGSMIEEAWKIANAGEAYRCDGVAWDLEFIPSFLKIVLDDELSIKGNWYQIANAFGQYLSNKTNPQISTFSIPNRKGK